MTLAMTEMVNAPSVAELLRRTDSGRPRTVRLRRWASPERRDPGPDEARHDEEQPDREDRDRQIPPAEKQPGCDRADGARRLHAGPQDGEDAAADLGRDQP